MSKAKILVVDDEKGMRDFLEIMLKREGYAVDISPSAKDAIQYIKHKSCDLVITDIKMPGVGGIGLLKAIKEITPETVVIMITAYASVDTAVEAMKLGALDYFTKPFQVDDIKMRINMALDRKKLVRENIQLKRELKNRYGFRNMIGTSKPMIEVYDLIKRIAKTKTSVLITGESGTGKELIAKAVHYEGNRKDGPFIAINCGAIPENLLESELFGYQKGAFTGAITNKAGLLEVADGGTVFLDEITEMPIHLQVKLLRFIQERSLRRVGGTDDSHVDVRIISASNRAIREEIKEGRFREDLYYRINVISIDMPALREKKEDIPLLAEHFREKYAKEFDKEIRGISSEAMEYLKSYDYPGNVRELENILERAVALENTRIILTEAIPSYVVNGPRDIDILRSERDEHPALPSGGIDLEETVEDFEKRMLREALEESSGVKKTAAKLLGLSFRSIRYKLEKYGMK